MDICPDCGSKKIEQKTEGKICGKCGLVVQEESYFSGRMLLV